MFSKNERARWDADTLRRNDFVSQRVLDDSILVDSRFVRERIGPHNGFVRRNLCAGDFREHAACTKEFFEPDSRRDSETFFAHREGDYHFLERSVTRALADPVDGALDLTDSRANGRERVGDRHAQVVMTMSAERNAVGIAEVFADLGEHRTVFFRHRVPHRVGQIQYGRARLHSGAADLAKKVDVGSSGVFGGEFHFAHVLAAMANHRGDGFERLLASHVQLYAKVQIGGGEKNVQSRGGGLFQCLDGRVHVLFFCASERRDGHGTDFLSDLLDRFEVAERRNREARFDHVYIQGRKLPCQANLLLGIHREARRLLAVTERSVKDAYDVHRVSHPVVTHGSGPVVQFIFILLLIILSYTDPTEGSVDLGELQVFLMVAKEGSFSRAAERLYRTQPAISLAIRKLEDGLGQPLFVRGARPIRLTDAGTLLKDYAERLINLRDEVKKGLSELEGLKRGELSLGVNESSIHALLPALAKFRELHPGVQVRVHRMFSRDIPHEVLNYRLDLGAVSFVPRDAQLLATEILKDELTLVVPPKHNLAKKREVDVAELGSENFIAHIVESPFRRRVIELFARNRTALNMPIEMPTIESIKRFVQMGMGVAIVPRMCVQWEIEHGWMKEVKIRQLNMPRHLYLVSRRGARLPHAAAELMRILREE